MKKKGKGQTREHLRRRAAGLVVRAWHGVLSAGFVVVMLRLLIVIELCLLGLGVVRRLENSYDRAMEAARMELAAIEAGELAEQQERSENAGFAGISAGQQQDFSDANKDSPDEAPDLRPRDVASIVSDETGDMDAAVSLLMPEEGRKRESREFGG